MNDKHLLNPDDPTASREVQEGLLEALAPLEFPPPRAGALKRRLFERIRASRDAGKDFIHVRLDEGEWESLLPGVRVKRLQGAERAVLIDMQPGAAIPFHRHHEDEECVVLRGEAQLGKVTVKAGDYHLARAGSRHGLVRSSTGALLYLRGTPIGHSLEVARDVLTALVPGRGQAPLTLHRDDGQWMQHAPGARLKLLRDDGRERAMLLKLDPGAATDFRDRPLDDECLVVEGEAFAGDLLMRAGDYRRAATGAAHPAIRSDVGCLLFMRGASPAAA